MMRYINSRFTYLLTYLQYFAKSVAIIGRTHVRRQAGERGYRAPPKNCCAPVTVSPNYEKWHCTLCTRTVPPCANDLATSLVLLSAILQYSVAKSEKCIVKCSKKIIYFLLEFLRLSRGCNSAQMNSKKIRYCNDKKTPCNHIRNHHCRNPRLSGQKDRDFTTISVNLKKYIYSIVANRARNMTR